VTAEGQKEDFSLLRILVHVLLPDTRSTVSSNRDTPMPEQTYKPFFNKLFQHRRNKIDHVSVIILTMNSEEYLPILLEFLADHFSEVIVGVDRKSSEKTFDLARRFTDKAFWIDNPGGIVEHTIEQLVSRCSNDWVLRLDDDELVSLGLVDFLEKHLSTLSVDAVGIHRKWCRVNLKSSCLEYSTNPLYGYDWQWRLFRKASVGFNKNVHTPGISFNTETKAPLDGFIVHLDWVYRDFGYRRDKVARYESISEGLGHSAYYLYELDTAHESFFAPLFVTDFDKATRRLIPFQLRSNAKSTAFLSQKNF
jgi:glycosyltransferase involved in cell wall biosynthesis